MRIFFLVVLSYISFICTPLPRIITIMAFSGPIAINVKLSIKADRREEFLQIIQEDGSQTLATEPGALQFVLGEDTETPNIFYLHEQYKATKDVEYHQSTPHFIKWKEFCDTDPFTAEPVIQTYLLGHMGLVPHPAQQLVRDSQVLTSWIPPSPRRHVAGRPIPTRIRPPPYRDQWLRAGRPILTRIRPPPFGDRGHMAGRPILTRIRPPPC